MKLLISLFLFVWCVTATAQTVTTMDYVKTKPGEFDNYVEFLKKNWVVAREKAKEKGFVVSFRFVTNPKDSVQDVTLITEYKDSAAYKNREKIFQQIFKEYFPNGPVLVNGKRSKDMAEIRTSKEVRKE